MKQPEALRLAITLEVDWHNRDAGKSMLDAALELRRLHEANCELLEALKEAEPMLAIMLKNITESLGGNRKMPALDTVRAAIAKAGEVE